jgi:hypothetical protein
MRWLTEHPASVGESYWHHMRVAQRFARTLILAGLLCFVHSLFPCLFTRSASSRVRDLHERMTGLKPRSDCAELK